MEIDYDNINFDSLREDLREYYIGAYYLVSEYALFEVDRVERASNEELIKIAKRVGFPINNYVKTYHR